MSSQYYNAQPVIVTSNVRAVYAECTPLCQLIKLISTRITDKSVTILEKIVTRNCSYSGFSYHVVNGYLNAYDPICKLNNCFVCVRIII